MADVFKYKLRGANVVVNVLNEKEHDVSLAAISTLYGTILKRRYRPQEVRMRRSIC